MTPFKQFVCWRDDAVLAVTPRDAASLSDGHFQAIHHPLRLRRRKLGERAGGQWVQEDDIVTALSGPLRKDGYLFLPILGGSGTGKSHLVRWVKDQTHGTPGWEVRYLPKNRTGLRRAIEIIIRDLEGPQIAEAREALAAAPAHTESDEILGERLLDELALLVSRPDEFLGTPPTADARAAQMRAKMARELPDVLRDGRVRRKLLEPGAVILRLVGLAVRGRHEGDGLDDDATRFQPSDLPLTFEDIGGVNKDAFGLLRQLAGLPSLLTAAVDLINEALPVAEKRITVSRSVDLVEVFREVRRALHLQGLELVLFIEDLTVLHGVEREFLDAIVEPVESDEGRMCNLRMIFAVTEGHFDDLDTVRTRCDDAYWLDAVYGPDGIDPDEAMSFLGRYLNAARLEPLELETSWARRNDGPWLRNACDKCDFQSECHDVFGVSAEGHGLYPYNPAAAERLVDAVSPERFDPRDVVRELANRFLLLGAADMRQATFPSAELLTVFDSRTEPLPPLFIAELRNRRPADHQRLANTLRYWSDIDDPTRVDSGVPEAFGLVEPGDDVDALRGLTSGRRRDAPRKTSTEESSSTGDPETALSGRMRTHFVALSAWAGQGQDLSAEATLALRKLIHKSVLNNLEFGPTAVNLGVTFTERRFRKSLLDIAIRGSVTQQTSMEDALILIERTDASAATLQGLLLLSELGESGFPDAERYRRLVADGTEQWTILLTERLSQPPSENTASTVQALLVAAAVTGRARDARTAADYLRAMFEEPPPTPDLARSDGWRTLHAQAEAVVTRSRPIVEVEFGESRGTGGGVRALQTHRLLPIVENFISRWDVTSPDAAIAPFYRSIGTIVDSEWRVLQQQIRETDGLIDRARTWSEQTEKVLQVLRIAHNAGRLDDGTVLDELSRLAVSHPDHAHRSLFAAAEQVTMSAGIPQQLAVLSSHIPSDVHAVWRFATRATKALDDIERNLAERQASEGRTGMEALTEQVLTTADRFINAVKGMA